MKIKSTFYNSITNIKKKLKDDQRCQIQKRERRKRRNQSKMALSHPSKKEHTIVFQTAVYTNSVRVKEIALFY